MSQFAAVVVAAVIFTLIYDPFHVSALVFLALTPITLVLCNPSNDCSLPRAGAFGFLFGLLASLGITGPWMFGAAFGYFDHGALWSLGFTLFVNATYVALFQVPAFVALRLLAYTPPVVRVIGAASVWIAFETLRATDPAGNPWATLGQAFAYFPLMREAAAFGGEPLLGWFAAMCGAAVGVGLQPDINTLNQRVCMSLGVTAPFVLALLGGIEHSSEQDISPLTPLRVAVVQAQIPSRDVWDPAQRMAHWNAYVTATGTIPVGSVDLVVWPESAVPFLLNADTASQTKLAELAKTVGAAILVGAPRSQDSGDGRASLHNSAYLFSPGAAGPRTYDKQRLLPYVENSPLPGSDMPDAADYRAGTTPEWFDIRGWRISPLLCFEAVYPEYARAAVVGGASLLVNMSNDAWFADGAGPEQHFAMSLMRTVELRRSMVRASNGGVSGAFGPDGEEIGFAIRRQKTVGIYEIPSPPRKLTLAATAPEVIPALAGVLALLTVLYGLQRSMTAPPTAPAEEE